MKAKTFKTVTLIMLIAVLLIGMTTIFLVGGNQAFDADAMMWGGSVANAATTLQTGAHVHKISESDANTTTFTTPLTADYILALSKEEISYEDGPFLVTGNYFLAEDILLPTRRALKIAGEATVTLCLNGHKLAGNGNSTIEVKQGATFNLCDCNGSNGSHSYTEAGTGEYVFGDGAAGTVDGTVSGGVITGGNVSGVYLYVSSSYSAYTAFNMYGGTIAGNIANSTSGSSGGGGVRIVGSKSYYTRTSFNMYGGTIAGNITDTVGGGVFVEYCIFNMSGGSIAKNRTYVAGGGIYASNSDVTLSGIAKIEGNRADVDNASYSRGIYFFGSDKTLTVSESAQILDNFAKSQYGSLRMDSGTLNVTGGKIAGGKTEGASATETSSDSDSGISLKGKTTVSGGVIEDNIIASGDLTVTEDAPDKAINYLFVNEKCTAYFDIAENKANKISAMGGYFARKSTSLTCPDSYAIVELVDSGLSSKDNYYKKGYPYSVYKKQTVFLEGYQIGTPTYDGMPIKKDADFTFYGSGTPSITAWKKKDGTESGTGDSLPKNAGTYTLTVSSPARITNMSEGSRNIYYYPAIEYMFDITIAKAIVNAPSISSKEYTGNVQTASVSVKETDQYSVTENNGGTTVGNYNVVLTLKDSTNYKWTDSDEATKTIVFKITKAKAEALSAPQITEGLVYGDKLSKIVLGDGWQWVNDTTPKVSDSNKTDYEVKKEVDDDNYDWTEIKGYANGFYTTTVKVTVEKATPEYTTPDGLTAIYGQTLNDVKLLENWTWDDEVTTKVGAVGKRSFSATFTPEDTDNYKTVTIELSIDVSKATYDMSGVEFLGATFVEDGSEKSLAISGDLPEGVYVTYENNGQSAFGIYEITAIFHGDYDNYYEITDMTAQLVIKRASMSQIVEEDGSDTPNVVVSEAGGTNPNFNLVVKKQETVSDEILDNVERDELVVFVYDITLQFNGSSVQPDRMLTIKLLIPEEIGDKSFRILHMHDGTVTELEYITEGGYAVFSVDNLSEFAIVADNLGSGLWLVIVLAVLLIVELILIISKKNKNKKKGETYLAGVFGGVLAIHEIVLLAVLGAAVVGLGIYAVCLYAPKKKTHRGESVDATANRAKSVETAWTIAAANDKDKQVLNKTECKADAVDVADDADAEREVAAAEAAVAQAQVVFDSVDALPDADKKNIVEVRLNRSLEAKIALSKDATKELFAQLANYILSFKGIKSRMSWKNLSFNKGRLKMAKLSVRGKTLVLFLALSPKEFEGSKYFCMDFSESTQYEKVPLALKVKSERGLKYAKELVDILMERCECDYVEQKDVFSAQDYPFDTVANLIKRGLIKVYSDKEIDATAELVNIGFDTRGKVSLQEAHTLMADSVARDMIVKVKTKKENCDRGNKCVINIDTLSEQFSAGDTVDMSAMKDKGLIPCKASFVKVLARGVLDKPLTVVADDFSVDAVKMILLTGGSAIVS